MLTSVLHERACKQCGRNFMQTRPMQYLCSPRCATKMAKDSAKKRTHETRERKQALKSLRELMAEAQVAVNAYVRARDQSKPCICCGKPFEPNKPGGSMDAGHYLARSIAPQHRFDADRNIFGQRKNCNRPGGATRSDFRAGVIERIGLAAVEALEADSSVTKWTREQLVEIKKIYRAKTRELVKARAA